MSNEVQKNNANYQKHNYRIPLEAIIELAEKNNSQTHIAKILGCHPSNISKRLKEIEITKKYINHKAFMIRHLERKIYENITDAKLKKANLQQLATSYGIIYDKGQLEEGGSTQNILYADALRASIGQHKLTLQELEDIRKQRQSDADINIVNISPTLDSQGIEEKQECL
jgi:predicted transcriptional regulator